jgi:SSS family solute:Na+ symporter
MSAVIWTEVLQAIIKTFGAILILWIILQKVSMDSIAQIGHAKGKFALGSFDLDFSTSSFWVIFLYGFFINLTNFGVDQNYIQRYHSANSTQEAQKSIWLCAIYYVPVSALFFFIGTALFVYYQTYPELILELKHQVGAEKGIALSQLKESDFGDRVLPFFLKTQIPKGFLGLLVAALLSAAMSTMSSGMNSSATVFLKDVYLRHVQPQADPKKQIRILQLSTLGMGILGMSFGIGMIGVKSLLDIWWKLSGIFAAGMLGLFLIGFLLKNLKSNKVKLALGISVILIAWMSFKDSLPQPLQLPFDSKMTIVLGTGSMLIFTWLLHKLGKNE